MAKAKKDTPGKKAPVKKTGVSPFPQSATAPIPKGKTGLPLVTKPIETPDRSIFDAPETLGVDTRTPLSPPESAVDRQREENLAKVDKLFVTTNPAVKDKWVPPKKVKQKPATDFPDVFNGGRSPYSPERQAQIIKDTQSGKLSKEQQHTVIDTARNGHIVPASVALSTMGFDLPPEWKKALASVVVGLKPTERSNVLASIPNIHHFNLFNGDEKKREAFLKIARMNGHDLPANPSDKQIIELLGSYADKAPKGWDKLNPLRDGPGNIVNNIGEGYLHPLFNDLVVAPAKLGAGTLGASFAVGKSIGTGDPKYAKEALNEFAQGVDNAGAGIADIVKHPGTALQNDPLGTVLTVATLGDAGAAKALAHGDGVLATKLRGGLTPEEYATTARNVHLGDYAKLDAEGNPVPLKVGRGVKSKRPLTRAIQDYLDRRTEGKILGNAPLSSLADATTGDLHVKTKGDALLSKNVRRDRDTVTSAGEQAVQSLMHDIADAAHKGRIKLSRQNEILATHAQGVTHEQMKGFYDSHAADIRAALDHDDALRAQRELEKEQRLEGEPKPQSATELHGLADDYEDQAVAERAQSEAKQNRLLSGVKSNTAKALAKQIREHESEAARFDRMAHRAREDAGALPETGSARLLTPKQRAKGETTIENLEKQAKIHTDKKTGEAKAMTPLNEHEQSFLNALRAAANHRTELAMTHGGLRGESAMFRDYETPINVAAKDIHDPLHTSGTRILEIRDELQQLEQENPGVKNMPDDPEHMTEEQLHYEDLQSELTNELHDFVDSHPADAFRVPREVPKQSSVFRRRASGGAITARDDFGGIAGSMQRTNSTRLRTGNFVQSLNPLLRDVAKAQKAANSVEFVKRILNGQKFGVVKVPKRAAGESVRAGDLVEHPDMFVLRSVTNLRRSIDTDAVGTKLDEINEADTAKKLEDAYKNALESAALHPDTLLPTTGKYVLIPKGVDDAIKGQLAQHDKGGVFSSAYRTQVLYTRPGFAVRNLAQALATNSLEGVGPLSYYRAAKNDLPVARGVENHGLAGQAVHGEYQNAHSLVNILRNADKAFGPVPSLTGAAQVGHGFLIEGRIYRSLIDTTKHLNVAFENFARRAAYQKLAVKAARSEVNRSTSALRRINTGMFSVTDDIKSLLDDFAKPEEARNPARAEATVNSIIDRIHAIQGDYKNMPDWSKAQAFVPFYRWYLFIGNLMLKLPFEYPIANQIVQGLGNIGGQVRANLGQDLNDPTQPIFGGGRTDTNVPIPGLTSVLTKATTINAEYPNPLTSLEDVANKPESLIPLIELFDNTIKSKDSYGNDLLDSNGQPLSMSGKFENVLGTAANLFAPLKVADSIMHPGPRSADSFPILDSKPRQRSAAAAQRDLFPQFHEPSDNAAESIFNWLTSAGVHEKNLSGDESTAADRALSDHYAQVRAKAKLAAKLAAKKAAKK